MTRTLTTIDQVDPRGGYVVRRPQECDSAGAVLRRAFGGEDPVPADLAALLRALENHPRN